MKRKAQVQMGETIAVLFVFFILVVVGFIFYVKVIKGNIEVEKEELSQLRSVGVVQSVLFLPELQCSEDNVITEDCIDVLKLEAAQNVMRENELFYFDLFKYSKVNITEIYPSENKWSIYSKEPEDFANKFVTNAPVSLFNPVTKKHSFGILSIETMST